jgi:phosphohistidine swiveling domain-containing protein
MQNKMSFEGLTINFADYTTFWEWNDCPFLWHDIFVYSVYNQRLIERTLGFQETGLLCICENNNYSFNLKQQEIESNTTKVLGFFSSESPYDNLITNIKRIIEEIIRLPWTNGITNWKDDFKSLSDKHSEAYSYYFCTEAHHVDSVYDFLIESGYDKEDILYCSPPCEMASVTKEQLEWNQILLSVKDEKIAEAAIEEHLIKWKYIIAHERMESYTFDKLLLRYNKDKRNLKSLRKMSTNLKSHYSSEHIQSVLENTKRIFSGDSRLLVERLREISYLRFELRQAWMKTGYLIKILLQEIFPDNKSVFEYSINEILKEDFSTVSNRKNFIYYADETDSFLLYNGIEKSIQFPQNNKEVSGKFSFGNDVRGVARVLGNNISLSESVRVVNKNSILVLPQTCPEHIPLLSLCKGIVVDEGGIAGHASIIAREMKIPAIIGTINGTKQIRSGENIHLDIESSCVRRE